MGRADRDRCGGRGVHRDPGCARHHEFRRHVPGQRASGGRDRVAEQPRTGGHGADHRARPPHGAGRPGDAGGREAQGSTRRRSSPKTAPKVTVEPNPVPGPAPATSPSPAGTAAAAVAAPPAPAPSRHLPRSRGKACRGGSGAHGGRVRRTRMMSRCTLGGVVVALALSWAAAARAEPLDDAARADASFKEAMQLRSGGHDAEACPKFAESQRLAPAVGVTLYLADCYEKTGRTASAWREFRVGREARARTQRQARRRGGAARRGARVESVPAHGVASRGGGEGRGSRAGRRSRLARGVLELGACGRPR